MVVSKSSDFSLLLFYPGGYKTGKMTVKAKERIIMGIDPGTNIMGFGVIKVTGRTMSYVAMDELDLRKSDDPFLKLKTIFEYTTSLIDTYLPDEIALEAPFYGKNVQSMLKLGRAQGVAMSAALMRQIPITEYLPRESENGHNWQRQRFKRTSGRHAGTTIKVQGPAQTPRLDRCVGHRGVPLFQQLPPKPRNGKLLRMGRVRPQQPLARERRVTARYKKEIINPGVTF